MPSALDTLAGTLHTRTTREVDSLLRGFAWTRPRRTDPSMARC